MFGHSCPIHPTCEINTSFCPVHQRPDANLEALIPCREPVLCHAETGSILSIRPGSASVGKGALGNLLPEVFLGGRDETLIRCNCVKSFEQETGGARCHQLA